MHSVREDAKYYFAEFVRKGVPPPPLRTIFLAKKELWILGLPPLPNFTDISLYFFLKKKRLKIVYIAQKTPEFGPKNKLRIWGLPPPPLYGQNFQRKWGYGFGRYPPPPLWTKSVK